MIRECEYGHLTHAILSFRALSLSHREEKIIVANQRKYSVQFKAKVVLEGLQAQESPPYACRTCKISKSVLTRWISMAEIGKPTQNGYAGQLMRTIKEGEVELLEYRNFEEAYQKLGKFVDNVYAKKGT